MGLNAIRSRLARIAATVAPSRADEPISFACTMVCPARMRWRGFGLTTLGRVARQPRARPAAPARLAAHLRYDHPRGDDQAGEWITGARRLCPRLPSLDAQEFLAFEKVSAFGGRSATANALYSPPWGRRSRPWRNGPRRFGATTSDLCVSLSTAHESAAT